jgi:P4 family phage/plasmid primase-like protien
MNSPLKLSLHECLSALSVARRQERDHLLGSVDFHTHVSMIHPTGRFLMDVTAMEQFWDLYCRCVEIGVRNIGLAEKSQEYLPVLVDFDIKVPTSSLTQQNTKLYDAEAVDTVAQIFQKTISELVDNVDVHELACFVLEKAPSNIESNGIEYVKNGFHLHFPYIFLKKEDHNVFLIPSVQKKLKELTGLFSSIGIEDPDKLFDKQYCTVPWLMYGSHKPEGYPYLLTRVLDYSGREIQLEEAVSKHTIYSVDETPINIRGKETFYLPRILSILPFHRKIHTVKPGVVSPIRLSMKKVSTVVHPELNTQQMTEQLKRASELLELVSDRRAESREDWMRIGWVLHNIGGGSIDALDIWTAFSRRCPEKFCESVCIDAWQKMERGTLTLGTLAYFAKIDNPQGYEKKILTERSMSAIQDSHFDIAQRIFNMYHNEYVCASITHNIWYKYENHHWIRLEDGSDLRLKISTDITSLYENQLVALKANMGDSSGWEKKMYEEGVKAISRLIKDLKSRPFKANVMKEYSDLFYQKDFLTKLDSNRFLFGFQNGVYDLRTNTLRDGIPEDYISTQSPLSYIDLNPLDRRVIEVYDCLQKVFPDKEVYNFFMDTTSEVFLGGNDRKLVLFWSGRGNNGKSVIQKFVERILGPYSIKFPTSLITGKRTQSSACTPELVRAGNGVRWAVVQEPDEREYINIGQLKELSGNDEFYARGLHRDGGEINPMFKLLVVCNKQPRLPHIDQAIINRICVIPYESTFADDAPDTLEEQLRVKRFPKAGNYIRDKVPELAQAFLWVLLDHRKRRGDTMQYPIPQKVKLATEKYIERNDHYRQFAIETFVDGNGKISEVELYTMFKEWLKMSVPGTSIPHKSDVTDYFEILWGPAHNHEWSGHVLREYTSAVESEHVEL